VTLTDLRTATATYLHKVVTNLTVNGLDLFLAAVNQARMVAELGCDFEFTRKLMSITVDGVTGGNLSTAVEYGTLNQFPIKTVLDVGQFDTYSNLIPVEWTVTEASLNTQRANNPGVIVRYPTDAQVLSSPLGWRRFQFSGNRIYPFPFASGTTFTLGIEAYVFTNDFITANYSGGTSDLQDIWLLQGSQYLQWQTIVQINQLFKDFVFRQEGNLPPPQDLATAGLSAIQTWDAFRYAQFRRRSR
jgi:hypothetical protein